MDFETRFALFQQLYSDAFKEGFDALAFREDHFYAAQILEKAIRRGTPDLQAVAVPIEARLLTSLDITVNNHGTVTMEPKPVPMAPAPLEGFEMQTVNLESASPQLPEPSKSPALPQASVAPVAQTAPTMRVAMDEWKERKETPLSSRQVYLLSQLRIEFRKAFGTYFDVVEFSRNDLYARSILKVCEEEDGAFLGTIAKEILHADEDARPIRRKGSADLELTLH